MTREEWSKHRTLDCIDSVSNYVHFMLYDAVDMDMDIHMCRKDLERLCTLLMILQGEVINQIRYLEGTDSENF